MKKEELKKSREEFQARAQKRGSENYDSGMPVVEGTVLSIVGYKTANENTAMEYTNFENLEGAILSDKHIGRRGNGLALAGDTNVARINAFMDEIDALAENQSIKVKVVKILHKRAIYDGRESLNSFYVFERV